MNSTAGLVILSGPATRILYLFLAFDLRFMAAFVEQTFNRFVILHYLLLRNHEYLAPTMVISAFSFFKIDI